MSEHRRNLDTWNDGGDDGPEQFSFRWQGGTFYVDGDDKSYAFLGGCGLGREPFQSEARIVVDYMNSYGATVTAVTFDTTHDGAERWLEFLSKEQDRSDDLPF